MIKTNIVIAIFILIVVNTQKTKNAGGLQSNEQFPISKILWVFWDNGYEGAQTFTKLCIHNMIHFTQKSGWQLRFLSMENITDYLSPESLIKIQFMFSQPHRNTMKIKANLGDIYRFFLIYEHGGLWMDINSFLVQDLSWIQHIYDEPGVMNKIGKYPNYLGFTQQPARDYKNTEYDSKLNMNIGLFPGYEAWVILAKKQNQMFKDILDNMIFTLATPRNTLFNYINQMGIALRSAGGQWFVVSNFQLLMTLQIKQKEIQLYPERFKTKYAVQYYKAWSMGCQGASFFVWYEPNSYWRTRRANVAYQVLKSISITDFYKENKLKAHFFKFTGEYYKYANQQFDSLINNICTTGDASFSETSIFYEFLIKYGEEIPRIKKFLALNNKGIDPKEKERLCSKNSDDIYIKRRNIWVYTLGKQNSNSLLTQLCRNNILHYAAENDWEVQFFSYQEVFKFISAEGKQKFTAITKDQKLNDEQKASIAKLILMYEKGGVLIDENTFFLRNLGEFFSVNPIPQLKSKFGYKAEFFGFGQTKKQENSLPTLEVSNFATQPKSLFLEDTLVYLQKHSKIQNSKFSQLLSNIFTALLSQKLIERGSQPKKNLFEQATLYYKVWNLQFQRGISVSTRLNSSETSAKLKEIPFLHQSSNDYLKQNKLQHASFIKFNAVEHSATEQLLSKLPQLLCRGDLKRINYNSVFNQRLLRFSGHLEKIDQLRFTNTFAITPQRQRCYPVIMQLKNVTLEQIQKVNERIKIIVQKRGLIYKNRIYDSKIYQTDLESASSKPVQNQVKDAKRDSQSTTPSAPTITQVPKPSINQTQKINTSDQQNYKFPATKLITVLSLIIISIIIYYLFKRNSKIRQNKPISFEYYLKRNTKYKRSPSNDYQIEKDMEQENQQSEILQVERQNKISIYDGEQSGGSQDDQQ